MRLFFFGSPKALGQPNPLKKLHPRVTSQQDDWEKDASEYFLLFYVSGWNGAESNLVIDQKISNDLESGNNKNRGRK